MLNKWNEKRQEKKENRFVQKTQTLLDAMGRGHEYFGNLMEFPATIQTAPTLAATGEIKLVPVGSREYTGPISAEKFDVEFSVREAVNGTSGLDSLSDATNAAYTALGNNVGVRLVQEEQRKEYIQEQTQLAISALQQGPEQYHTVMDALRSAEVDVAHEISERVADVAEAQMRDIGQFVKAYVAINNGQGNKGLARQMSKDFKAYRTGMRKALKQFNRIDNKYDARPLFDIGVSGDSMVGMQEGAGNTLKAKAKYQITSTSN